MASESPKLSKEEKKRLKKEKKRKLKESEGGTRKKKKTKSSDDEADQAKDNSSEIARQSNADEIRISSMVEITRVEPLGQEDGSNTTTTRSTLQIQKLRCQVALLPHAIGDEYNRILRSVRYGLLLKYHQSMNGILMAFRNLKFIREGKGWIRNELPHIHYFLEAEGLVFCPDEGMEVR